MDTTYATTKVMLPPKRNEPRLSRKALLETLDDRSKVTQFIQKQPYTCIVLLTWYNEKEYVGYGFSKVCYPDKWDGEEGADIAKKRALYMVYHQVRADEEQRAREMVASIIDEVTDELELNKDDLIKNDVISYALLADLFNLALRNLNNKDVVKQYLDEVLTNQ